MDEKRVEWKGKKNSPQTPSCFCVRFYPKSLSEREEESVSWNTGISTPHIAPERNNNKDKKCKKKKNATT
jgi:hypothetical protein